MKRLALTAVLAAATVLAVWAPAGGSATADVRITCKSRGIDVYFWPNGRPKVKALGFTAYPQPHLTVYKKGSFASKSFFMFISATSYNYANTCELATNPLGTTWGGGPKKTVTATRRIRCTFPIVAQLKIIPAGGSAGGRFVVARGGSPKELVTSRIKAKGSTLTYDSRYCAATKVPGVS